MTKEALAQLIVDELRAQAAWGLQADTSDLSSVGIDETFDLLALAEAILEAHMNAAQGPDTVTGD